MKNLKLKRFARRLVYQFTLCRLLLFLLALVSVLLLLLLLSFFENYHRSICRALTQNTAMNRYGLSEEYSPNETTLNSY